MICPICNSELMGGNFGYRCFTFHYEISLKDERYSFEFFDFGKYAIERSFAGVYLHINYNEFRLGNNDEWPFSKFSNDKFMNRIMVLL